MTNTEKQMTPAVAKEVWYDTLRANWCIPHVEYSERNYQPIRLAPVSSENGWSLYSHGNAIILVHEFGQTITMNCSDFENGCTVIATMTDEAPSGPNPRPTVGTGVITNDRIASAFNVAMHKAFDAIR